MIKRIAVVGVLTGIGHLTTLLALKYISKLVPDSTIAFIGEIDSLTLLIVSIVAFGLQLSATRNIAIKEDWKKELYETQSARFMLSIILLVIGFTGFWHTKNFMFFMAPVISLNADYALYGRGKPIFGSFVALIRVLIPSLTLVISSLFFKDHIVLFFALSLILTYLLAGMLVANSLDVDYLVRPKWRYIKKYIENFNIGIASFSLFFIGIGIINVLSYFYNNETIAIAYIALKLYMIFKGVRRIIVQAFFSDLKDTGISLRVDLLAVLGGLVFLNSLLFYPKVIIPLLFDEKFVSYTTTFLVLGVAGLISSFTTSSGTRLLLNNQDKEYSRNLITAAIITISAGIILYHGFGDSSFLISLSVLMGELTLSILNVYSIKQNGYFSDRIKGFYPYIIMSFVFIGTKYVFGVELYSYCISLALFAGIVFFFIRSKFKNSI